MDIETKVVIGGIIFRSMFSIHNDKRCKICRKKITRSIKKELSKYRNDVVNDSWLVNARNKRYIELMELTTIIMNNAYENASIGTCKQIVKIDPYNMIMHFTRLYPEEMESFNINIEDFVELQKCYQNSGLLLKTVTYVNRLRDQIEYFRKSNYQQ